jgi:hypothetical protein
MALKKTHDEFTTKLNKLYAQELSQTITPEDQVVLANYLNEQDQKNEKYNEAR